uniref:Uncharacterized protein n=1 Tax=Mesocestoides corti TaxID=53468 RepID=A0A5K3F4X2_MESCO
SFDRNLEHPSPCIKKAGTTEQALLTNHKAKPNVRHHPSESATLAEQFILHSSR